MNNPPSGTVTFLFTDIEGSTKRWEAHPQQMQAALQRHDIILRSAIENNGGYVFKTVGDAFYSAFPTPLFALQAALQAQRDLQAEERPQEMGSVPVRMALHTGMVEQRDGDYFGQPLNRVARLLSAGHGGQVLLSDITQGLVKDNLPPATNLLDLGEHRLKDLTHPEHIFQLVAPGLPSEFPPLKTLDNRPNNLPVQPTPLIGREKELAEAEQMLMRSDVGLLTLTGPGGTGKTRLSLQVGADLLDNFSDGVWFIELAALTDHRLVFSEIASKLGLTEQAGRALLDTLRDYFRDKQMLLMLDNFEQVVEAAAQVGQLLASSPNLKVLVTSRIPLRIKGEKEYLVSPLAIPDIRPGHLPSIERLTQYAAVCLFIERATDIKSDFRLTKENAPAVAEICVRLDGLPLAIELAAARIRMLSPQAMLSRLQNRLKMLTGGGRDLTSRQQTLRGAIDWSYDLLDGGHKQLFARMAVFQGGRTLEALEAVCNSEGLQDEGQLQVEVFDGVETLLSSSLIQQREGTDGEPRFWMLETIHEYAREKLEESGEAAALQREHAVYFMKLAEEAEPHLIGARQQEWLNRLEEEHDNLRAALSYSLGGADERPNTTAEEVGLRLAGALTWFWYFRGYLREGHSWLIATLAPIEAGAGNTGDNEGDTRQIPKPVLAKTLSALGIMSFLQSDYVAARTYLERAILLWRELGDMRGIAFTGTFLGRVATRQGDPTGRELSEESAALFRQTGERWDLALSLSFLGQSMRDWGDLQGASALHNESLMLYKELGHDWGVALELSTAGRTALNEGNYSEARSQLEMALVIQQDVGDRRASAWTFHALGDLAREEGDLMRAISFYSESLGLFRDLGDKEGIARSLGNLGNFSYTQGDYLGARSLYEQSLAIWKEVGDKQGIALSLAGLGELAIQSGQSNHGAKLLGAAGALHETIGAVMEADDRASYDRAITSARAQLGEEALEQVMEEGRAMSMEQAIEYALDESQEQTEGV